MRKPMLLGCGCLDIGDSGGKNSFNMPHPTTISYIPHPTSLATRLGCGCLNMRDSSKKNGSHIPNPNPHIPRLDMGDRIEIRGVFIA